LDGTHEQSVALYLPPGYCLNIREGYANAPGIPAVIFPAEADSKHLSFGDRQIKLKHALVPALLLLSIVTASTGRVRVLYMRAGVPDTSARERAKT
jgi:hypothetical protein